MHEIREKIDPSWMSRLSNFTKRNNIFLLFCDNTDELIPKHPMSSRANNEIKTLENELDSKYQSPGVFRHYLSQYQTFVIN